MNLFLVAESFVTACNSKSCLNHINLTFHLARHTFATTVTLSNGVPIESTTRVYAKVMESKLSNNMKLLRQKLDINTSVEKKNQEIISVLKLVPSNF